MPHAFRIVNVFTQAGDVFSGNPLCVFEDARGLDDAQMQALARQMNLSETTFVLPPTDPTSGADARVRIFTPGFEMPFAGHPTLGTASVIGAQRFTDDVTLELVAGLVHVVRDPDSAGRAHATWTLRAAQAPVTRPVLATRAELAQMVGLPAAAICDEPLWVSTGVEQLVIPIATAAQVRAAVPDPALLARWGYASTRQEAMAYLVARDAAPDEPPKGGAAGGAAGWTVRFFFTSHGAVIEDPATGSACANLGGWWIARNYPRPLRATLFQGSAVGRPSQLGLHVAADDRIYVSGSVVELGRGEVSVDPM